MGGSHLRPVGGKVGVGARKGQAGKGVSNGSISDRGRLGGKEGLEKMENQLPKWMIPWVS